MRASTGGSGTVVLLQVVDRGLEELGTVSLRRRSLGRILEDEQDSYPDEGAEKGEPAEWIQTGAVIPPGPFTVQGVGAGADHVRVY